MDEQAFARELSRYPVVRGADWVRDWSRPGPGDDDSARGNRSTQQPAVDAASVASASEAVSLALSAHASSADTAAAASSSSSSSRLPPSSSSEASAADAATHRTKSSSAVSSSSSSSASYIATSSDFWDLLQERVGVVYPASKAARVAADFKRNYASTLYNLSAEDINILLRQLDVLDDVDRDR